MQCKKPQHSAFMACHTIYMSCMQGGAIAYAAAVASAYGVKACVVTAAGPDADLAVFSGHELHVVPTNSTLTFEHSYTWWGEHLPCRCIACSLHFIEAVRAEGGVLRYPAAQT